MPGIIAVRSLRAGLFDVILSVGERIRRRSGRQTSLSRDILRRLRRICGYCEKAPVGPGIVEGSEESTSAFAVVSPGLRHMCVMPLSM